MKSKYLYRAVLASMLLIISPGAIFSQGWIVTKLLKKILPDLITPPVPNPIRIRPEIPPIDLSQTFFRDITSIINHVNIGSLSENLTLRQAVDEGLVKLEPTGDDLFQDRGKDLLSYLVEDNVYRPSIQGGYPEIELTGYANEFEAVHNVLKAWGDLSISDRNFIETQLFSILEDNNLNFRLVSNNTNIGIGHIENQIGFFKSEEYMVINIALQTPEIRFALAGRVSKIIQQWDDQIYSNLCDLKTLGFYVGETKLTVNKDIRLINSIYKLIGQQFGSKITMMREDLFTISSGDLEPRILSLKKLLQSKLETIGLEGDMDASIKFYQQYKNVSQTGTFSESLWKVIDQDIQTGVYFSKDKTVYHTRNIIINERIEKVFELRPNLFVRFNNNKTIDQINSALTTRKFVADEIEIISLVMDDATNTVLRKNFPNNHLTFDVPSMQNLISMIRSKKRKTLVIVGHIEMGNFVTPLEGGKTFKISLNDLKRLGKELGVNIFPIGCNSGYQGTGILNKFNSVDALNRLKPAIENNDNALDLLEALAGSEFEIIIDQIPFGDLRYREEKIKGVLIEIGGEVAVGIGLYYSSSEGEEESANGNR